MDEIFALSFGFSMLSTFLVSFIQSVEPPVSEGCVSVGTVVVFGRLKCSVCLSLGGSSTVFQLDKIMVMVVVMMMMSNFVSLLSSSFLFFSFFFFFFFFF